MFQFDEESVADEEAAHSVVDKVDSGEPVGREVVYFEASNGLESRRFCRFIVGNKCAAVPEHLGFRNAGPSAEFSSVDPFPAYMLAPRMSGYSLRHSRAEEVVSYSSDDLEIFAARADVPGFGNGFVRGLARKGEEIRSFGAITDGPEYLLVANGVDPEHLTNQLVDELFEFEGFRYPRRFNEVNNRGIERSFHLLDVSHFDSDSVRQWLPPWPPGTVILDSINGVTTRLPFDVDELAEIKKRMRANCPAIE